MSSSISSVFVSQVSGLLTFIFPEGKSKWTGHLASKDDKQIYVHKSGRAGVMGLYLVDDEPVVSVEEMHEGGPHWLLHLLSILLQDFYPRLVLLKLTIIIHIKTLSNSNYSNKIKSSFFAIIIALTMVKWINFEPQNYVKFIKFFQTAIVLQLIIFNLIC